LSFATEGLSFFSIAFILLHTAAFAICDFSLRIRFEEQLRSFPRGPFSFENFPVSVGEVLHMHDGNNTSSIL